MDLLWHLVSPSGAEGRYRLPSGDVTWPHPRTGAVGSASFTVPRGHAAETLIATGMWATMIDESLGDFPGWAAASPAWGAYGVTVAVAHVSHIFRNRRCYRTQELRGLTAGAIVREAFSAALRDGLAGHVTMGAVMEAPPVVMSYELNGQTFDDVLREMEDRTGQTWRLDGPVFTWGVDRPVAYPPVLTQDGDVLMTAFGPTEKGDRVGQVIAKDRSGRVMTSPDVAPRLTDRQVELRLDTVSLSELQEAADREVARTSRPTEVFALSLFPGPPDAAARDLVAPATVSGRIPRLMINTGGPSAFAHRRAVREGTVVRYVLPRSRASGDAGKGRVVSRRWRTDTGLIDLEVEAIPPIDATTIQAVGRGVSRGVQLPPVNPLADALLALKDGAQNGSVGDEQIRLVDGRKVWGPVGSAQRAAQLANLSGLPSGTVPAGVSVPGAQVTGTVAAATTATTATTATSATTATTATNLASLAGLPNGATPVGVTVTGPQVTSPVANATLAAQASAVVANGVDAAALQALAATTPKLGLTANTAPALSGAGTATAVPATPPTRWMQVTDTTGATGWVPVW